MPEIEWKISDLPVDYGQAVRFMEDRVAAIHAGQAAEMVWLLQHPPIFTAGTSAKPEDLIWPDRFPVYRSGRGGQYTYHGPGQRIAYVMMDLRRQNNDLRKFIKDLEDWVIQTLAVFNVRGEIRDGRVGVWVRDGVGRENKIAAIGIRVRRWVSYHGISLNVDPDLSHYDGIVPCGIADHGVTSLDALGLPVTLAEVDQELIRCFDAVFGFATNDSLFLR